jgi:hypothetical protein
MKNVGTAKLFVSLLLFYVIFCSSEWVEAADSPKSSWKPPRPGIPAEGFVTRVDVKAKAVEIKTDRDVVMSFSVGEDVAIWNGKRHIVLKDVEVGKYAWVLYVKEGNVLVVDNMLIHDKALPSYSLFAEGKVMAIDLEERTVNIRLDKETAKTFSIKDSTKFEKDGKEIKFANLAVGDSVKLVYGNEMRSDKLFAKKITVLPKTSGK